MKYILIVAFQFTILTMIATGALPIITKTLINNAVSTGTKFTKNIAFYVPIGCVSFARYCGKMYSRHLFPHDRN